MIYIDPPRHMKAVVATKSGTPDVLELQTVPCPRPRAGWVLLQVKAFGLNRAELFTRQGDSPGVTFPRILGIEAVGVVVTAPETSFHIGQTVVAMMGGMGRFIDGGYAEYTLVPASSCHAITTTLDWVTLGAIPEMFQTTWGALHTGLEIQTGQTLLIRGGTSSIGMTATCLAKAEGLTVISTTRNPNKVTALKENGADIVVMETEQIAGNIHKQFPEGVDRVLELIGTKTLRDSLQATKTGGIVCMAGILGGEWVWEKFEPFLDIPVGVKLTTYGGEADSITTTQLQAFVDQVAEGTMKLNIDHVFQLEEVAEAHRYMEANRAKGKLVVLVNAHN